MTNPLDDLLKRYEQELIAIQNRKAQAKRSYELECQNEHRYQGAIIGVKDATNDLFRPVLTRKNLHKDFCYLSGEDGTALAYLAQGGHGCISVTANIAPKLCSDMQKFSKSNLDNELKEAQKIDKILQPVHKSLFIESNPAPVKYAAKLLGLCSDEIRLPLVNIKKDTEEVVKKALKSAKLI